MENFNFALFFGHLAVYLFVWVFAITTQGALTAWMADYFGDDTAKNQGRLSFSPFRQADPLGTIIMPTIAFVIGWLTFGGIPFIAWGTPVPVDVEKFERPKFAGIMVTLASTFATVLLALISFVLLKAMLVSGLSDVGCFLEIVIGRNPASDFTWHAPVEIILWYGLVINLIISLFSLIPLPPFNGGVVLLKLLPESFKPLTGVLNSFGLVISLVLIYLFAADYVFGPILNGALRLLLN